MKNRKLPQKLISFTDADQEFRMVEEEVANGWNIVSMATNAGNYVCLLEKQDPANDSTIYIPPRKKIKIK